MKRGWQRWKKIIKKMEENNKKIISRQLTRFAVYIEISRTSVNGNVRFRDFGLVILVFQTSFHLVVNNDELGSLIESNSRQTVQNLMNRLGASQFPPCSNISTKQENCTGKEYEYHVTFVESI